MKTFEYNGITVTAIGNYQGGASMLPFSNPRDLFFPTLTPPGYSYESFAKAARKKHLFCDIYKIDGRYVVPANSGFLYVDFWNHRFSVSKIKRVEDYSCWYKPAREEESND